MKRHSRQLLKRRKKRIVRRQQVLGHAPPFWFKRQVQEIRAAQMEKYRQRRPKPEPVYYYSYKTIATSAYYDEPTTTASSRGWGKP